MAAISAGRPSGHAAGAGYDDRALRFRTTGVRFFELDHPATQADKAKRLRAIESGTAGLTLAPADFRAADVAAVLSRCGHDAGRPSLFICEGLLVYLDQPTCERLLAGLGGRPGEHAGGQPGRSPRWGPLGPGGRRRQRPAAVRAPRPWRTILSLDAHLALLDRTGWRVEQTIDAAELNGEAVPGRTRLVTAGPGGQPA